jgi:hypothetical protein
MEDPNEIRCMREDGRPRLALFAARLAVDDPAQ